jgi:hypothetical protein
VRGRLRGLAGLGLLVGAVFASEAGGQQQPPRPRADSARRTDSLRVAVPARPAIPDSILRDSVRVRDSLRAANPPRPARDSIQAPIARAEAPPLFDVAGDYRWTRDSLYTTGALTLVELLERVPGLTAFRAGWLAAPVVASYLGDLARVRVFYDGVELPPIDPRAGSVRDLSWIQLWPLEEVRVERGASEVRVHLRTWRVDRLTPASRVDVATGDQNTNLFRGYFGRRYGHGEVLQVGGQQFSTTPSRLGASSDQLSLLARVGIARRGWGVDGFVVRTSARRGLIRRIPEFTDFGVSNPDDSIRTLDATRTDAYLRAGVGDPEQGPWVQALAASISHQYTGVLTKPDPGDTTQSVGDPSDTTATHVQYVLTGGWTRGPLRLSAANRTTVFRGDATHVPSVRASLEGRWGAASLFADGRGLDSTSRIEAAARTSPLSFVALAGAVGTLRDDREGGTDGLYGRAEGAVRLGALWLGGGLLRRAEGALAAPSIFGDTLREPSSRRAGESANGTFAFVRGRVYKALQADLMGIRWSDTSAYYRPRFQARSELFIATTLPRRFPSGNFGLRVALLHEYRSGVRFPNGAEEDRVSVGSRALSGLIEIRIVDATIQYQYRNLLAADYEQVPGFLMPRQTQYYGVRWNFWN